MFILWTLLIILVLVISILLIFSKEIRLYTYYSLRYGIANSHLYVLDGPIKSKVIGKYRIKRDSKINFYLKEDDENIEGTVIGFSKDDLIIIKGNNGIIYKYSTFLINNENLLYLKRR